MHTFIHIPASGLPRYMVVDGDHMLAALQAAVGGYIEPVPVDEHTLYVNEEGKTYGLPANAIATRITRGVLTPFDIVRGDTVLTGPIDAEGGETSVNDDFVAGLLSGVTIEPATGTAG